MRESKGREARGERDVVDVEKIADYLLVCEVTWGCKKTKSLPEFMFVNPRDRFYRSVLLCMLFCSNLALGFTRKNRYSSSLNSAARLFSAIMSQDKDGIDRRVVVVLAGPTAVGKSDVAAKLCADHKGIIVSADSVQAYRGVQIGANKPTKEEMEATPHLLIDVADATNTYNAAEWTEDAIFCIRNLSTAQLNESTTDEDVDEDTKDRWRKLEDNIRTARTVKGTTQDEPLLPVVVGGTMMYLQWLVHGRPDAIRPTEMALQKALSTITEFQDATDWEGAVKMVSTFGPKFTQQIEKLSGRDWYRLRRILEVAYTVEEKGDESLIEGLYSGQRSDKLESLGFDVRCFFLCPTDRMVHSKVIDERCEQMILRGLLQETTNLACLGQLPDMATKAIGYRQALDYLESKETKDRDKDAFVNFLEDFTTATRRYSKRQMQWFRRDRDFVFVPISFDDDKKSRVELASSSIGRLVTVSRKEFEQERDDPNGMNEPTREANEAQGKKMKTYQFARRTFTEGSDALKEVLETVDECRHRFQSKRAKHGTTTS
eukprot:scaffold9735_cov174-Amphora_coffeaeformis.AAC.8